MGGWVMFQHGPTFEVSRKGSVDWPQYSMKLLYFIDNEYYINNNDPASN